MHSYSLHTTDRRSRRFKGNVFGSEFQSYSISKTLCRYYRKCKALVEYLPPLTRCMQKPSPMRPPFLVSAKNVIWVFFLFFFPFISVCSCPLFITSSQYSVVDLLLRCVDKLHRFLIYREPLSYHRLRRRGLPEGPIGLVVHD